MLGNCCCSEHEALQTMKKQLKNTQNTEKMIENKHIMLQTWQHDPKIERCFVKSCGKPGQTSTIRPTCCNQFKTVTPTLPNVGVTRVWIWSKYGTAYRSLRLVPGCFWQNDISWYISNQIREHIVEQCNSHNMSILMSLLWYFSPTCSFEFTSLFPDLFVPGLPRQLSISQTSYTGYQWVRSLATYPWNRKSYLISFQETQFESYLSSFSPIWCFKFSKKSLYFDVFWLKPQPPAHEIGVR